jgi:hypothetical protein
VFKGCTPAASWRRRCCLRANLRHGLLDIAATLALLLFPPKVIRETHDYSKKPQYSQTLAPQAGDMRGA